VAGQDAGAASSILVSSARIACSCLSYLCVDQSQEQYLMWLVNTLVLPAAYW
jgi:hypothetical protein